MAENKTQIQTWKCKNEQVNQDPNRSVVLSKSWVPDHNTTPEQTLHHEPLPRCNLRPAISIKRIWSHRVTAPV